MDAESISVLLDAAPGSQTGQASSYGTEQHRRNDMRVFVTGATGFVGSAVVKELIGAGHTVLGLARSDAGARGLSAAGAEVLRGDLEDLETLRAGAAQADGVIHTAFRHDWTRFAESCELDRRAIEALGSALEGSDRPLLVTSGLAVLAQGRVATENDPPAKASAAYPRVSEATGEAVRARGVNVSVVRLPQVHNPEKQGLITYMVSAAREKGVSPYVGDGLNGWAAVHVLDAARVYRLALERREDGARYHAVAEEGVPARVIAEAIGRRLNVPVVSLSKEEAEKSLGFLARFADMDLRGSSELTQQKLGWRPSGPGLLEDLAKLELVQA
jgi:nucleoside-diphosphate-sugar epimerase